MVHSPPLIAVVDDDAPLRTALGRLLRTSGYEVKGFGCAEEFLAARDALAPDCLVLDLHMPGMSGFDVQQRLVTRGLALPVVVITGQDSPVARSRAVAGGACAYLCKPLDKDALIGAIEGALKRTAAKRQ
ncbi:MAG: response regulator [Burkholderiaceae bacterium]|nr:response regulator [Burkholderiaceae bacterium]